MNVSTAVMNRRVEPMDSADDFPTPPWAARALMKHLSKWYDLSYHTCREPAANRCHMADALGEGFLHVAASDVFDYGHGVRVADYLAQPMPMTDWVITNPPFKLALKFVQKALTESRVGCAFFVRLNWLESVGRYNELFSVNPPTHVLQFSERVVLHKGKLTATGSTATAYCWMVWLNDQKGAVTQLHWVPPCRKSLEKTQDYAGYAG